MVVTHAWTDEWMNERMNEWTKSSLLFVIVFPKLRMWVFVDSSSLFSFLCNYISILVPGLFYFYLLSQRYLRGKYILFPLH